jgi:hypothetical protein
MSWLIKLCLFFLYSFSVTSQDYTDQDAREELSKHNELLDYLVEQKIDNLFLNILFNFSATSGLSLKNQKETSLLLKKINDKKNELDRRIQEYNVYNLKSREQLQSLLQDLIELHKGLREYNFNMKLDFLFYLESLEGQNDLILKKLREFKRVCGQGTKITYDYFHKLATLTPEKIREEVSLSGSFGINSNALELSYISSYRGDKALEDLVAVSGTVGAVSSSLWLAMISNSGLSGSTQALWMSQAAAGWIAGASMGVAVAAVIYSSLSNARKLAKKEEQKAQRKMWVLNSKNFDDYALKKSIEVCNDYGPVISQIESVFNNEKYYSEASVQSMKLRQNKLVATFNIYEQAKCRLRLARLSQINACKLDGVGCKDFDGTLYSTIPGFECEINKTSYIKQKDMEVVRKHQTAENLKAIAIDTAKVGHFNLSNYKTKKYHEEIKRIHSNNNHYIENVFSKIIMLHERFQSSGFSKTLGVLDKALGNEMKLIELRNNFKVLTAEVIRFIFHPQLRSYIRKRIMIFEKKLSFLKKDPKLYDSFLDFETTLFSYKELVR